MGNQEGWVENASKVSIFRRLVVVGQLWAEPVTRIAKYLIDSVALNRRLLFPLFQYENRVLPGTRFYQIYQVLIVLSGGVFSFFFCYKLSCKSTHHISFKSRHLFWGRIVVILKVLFVVNFKPFNPI